MALSMQAHATYPVQIGFTLEGCRLETGATYDQTTYTCTDEGYTTGNLGKLWNELDYVPHRVTLHNGGANQTFDFLVSGDYKPNGASTIGWDDITALTLNPSLSDGSCAAVLSSPVMITAEGGGAGGAFQTIYRQITATMVAGETCVYDYAQRLSLGASEFSGSSLQSNLWNEDGDNSNIGQKRIQLPVADILPQELSKDMSAQQDTNFTWNLTKTANPSTLEFGDSCLRDDPMTETSTIRIEWQRLPGAPGMVTVVTNIYAHNPAHLDVHVSVDDTIYGDIGAGEVALDTASAIDVLVPAGSTTLLLTHQFNAPANVSGLNDYAVATYKVGGDIVPGDTDATASTDVQPSGTSNNETAVITDVEGPITGTGYSFSVDGVDGDGSFQGGYVLGDVTTAAVTWVSSEQSGDGYVEFDKTIHLDEPRNTNGQLPDVATLVSGVLEISKNAAILFSDVPTVDLTIHKSIDKDILDGVESATFYFDVYGPGGIVSGGDDVAITIEAGETSGSATVEGLDPGVEYSVIEVGGSGGFLLDPDTEYKTIVLPDCGGDVYFQNVAVPASAKVIKVTVPAGHDPSGFEFTLKGPGLPVNGVTAVSDSNGDAVFVADLFEGVYEVTETEKAGWQLTDILGESVNLEAGTCGFEVNLPEDANYQFLCTFENTKLATIIITKRVEGNNALDLSGSFAFDSSVGDFDTLLAAQSWSFSDALSGAEESNTFENLFPGTYDVTEAVPPLLWGFTDVFCDDPTANSSVDTDPSIRLATIELDPGETVECTFVNTKLAAPGNLIVYKQTIGDVGTFDYDTNDLAPFDIVTTVEDAYTTDGDAQFNGLEPGFYSFSETIPAGWKLTDLFCIDETSIDGNLTEVNVNTGEVIVSIDNGETVSCYFTNTRQGYIRLHKETVPDADPQTFEFNGYLNGFIGDGESIPAVGYTEVEPNALYTSTEIVPDGWDLTNISCVETKVENTGIFYQTSSVQFNVQPGEYIDCTFTNTKRGMADLLKTVSGVEPNGSYAPFSFQIRSGGTTVATASSDPVTGEAVFSCVGGYPEICVNVDGMAKLLPGNYAFCEVDLTVGWENTGTVENGAISPLVWYNPDPLDNSTECADFSISAGETLHFKVDNVPPPGGDARTIGYWKNWSSCTNGGQYDKYLADIADGTLDEYNSLDHHLPIPLYGDLDTGFVVDSCELGVSILDKRDFDSGKKMAGDPAYGMAAQLMAAILNLDSNAAYCPELLDAVSDAQDLLESIGFDATGKYLKGGPAAQEANYLAGVLDAYNNNELCPPAP
ncbi:MSCRAMM family protein [Marinobacterium lutimaris]|nr:hypothetical protein [Marinobacterium lutimaris]